MSEAMPFLIAVVEDDFDLRLLLSTALKRENFAVVEAGTLEDAERLLLEYPWDMAILDRHLPGGDALSLCERIRRDEHAVHRYVMVLSADDSTAARKYGFETGVDDYVGKPFDLGELLARVRAALRIVAYQKDLLGRMQTLEQMSVVDPLTQVYNRRFLELELTRSIDLALRYGRPLSVAMIDIDHFKNTNDTYGHGAGDRVLVELSTALIQHVRSADVVARYGGEEFALILVETPLVEATAIVERLRGIIENLAIPTSAGDVHVTISAGVSSLPPAGSASPAALLESADKSLYEAKSAGRNRVVAAAQLGFPPIEEPLTET